MDLTLTLLDGVTILQDIKSIQGEPIKKGE